MVLRSFSLKNITNDKVTSYICQYYHPVNEDLAQLRQMGEKDNVPIILKETEMILTTLLNLKRPLRILEIGTAIGYSSIYFASVCPDAEVYTIEKNEQMLQAARHNIKEAGLHHRIHSLFGDGQEQIEKLASQGIHGFDFVFIDAFLEVGASYSEIITNSLIGIIALIIVYIRKYIGFGKVNLHWLKDYLRIGLFSGLQIFLDNFIYAIMICKMVNAVSESGNYWVANNFIWGWLLIPIMVITEIIKKNNLEKLEFKNTWKYGLIVSVLWLISVPGWRWFIINVMSSDANTILNILYPLVPFYIAYIISSFIDGWFISKGKTIYNTINSFLVNIVYYGIAFILFNKGLFELNIMFVILLFGFGNVFHMLISMLLYKIEIKRKNKEI